MEEDLWRHRSEGMQCKACMYYTEKTPGLGRCRRHAPTLQGWPAMFPDDWCGDHKLYSLPGGIEQHVADRGQDGAKTNAR